MKTLGPIGQLFIGQTGQQQRAEVSPEELQRHADQAELEALKGISGVTDLVPAMLQQADSAIVTLRAAAGPVPNGQEPYRG